MNKISGQATLAVYCSSIIFCLNRTLAYWFSMLRLISQFLQLRLSNNINPAYNGCNILLTNNIMLSILHSLSFFIWVWETIGNIALTSFNALHNWFVRAITSSNYFILPIRRKANTTTPGGFSVFLFSRTCLYYAVVIDADLSLLVFILMYRLLTISCAAG